MFLMWRSCSTCCTAKKRGVGRRSLSGPILSSQTVRGIDNSAREIQQALRLDLKASNYADMTRRCDLPFSRIEETPLRMFSQPFSHQSLVRSIDVRDRANTSEIKKVSTSTCAR